MERCRRPKTPRWGGPGTSEVTGKCRVNRDAINAVIAFAEMFQTIQVTSSASEAEGTPEDATGPKDRAYKMKYHQGVLHVPFPNGCDN